MSTLDNDLNATARLADLSVGDELPTIYKFPDEAQLFLYSAASHNPASHPLRPRLRPLEGYEDILVHGPLQGAWLTQYVTDWAGPRARLENVTWQNRASALAGEELVYSGTVTSVDAQSGAVELEIAEHTSDGRLLMPATARVRLPPDPD